MKKMILNRLLDYQLTKFVIIGFSNTIISYSLFIFSYEYIFTNNIFLSQCVSYAAGIVWSFFWNKNWTFSEKAQPEKAQSEKTFAAFLVLQIILLICSAFCIEFLVNRFTLNKSLVWLFIMLMTTIINFIITKKIIFRA